MKNRIISGFLALVLCAGLIGGCGASQQKSNQSVTWSLSLSSKQLFRIEKEKCSMSQGRLLLANYKNIYTDLYGIDIWANGSTKASYYQDIKKIAISQLAKVTCMDLLAEKKEVSLSQSEQELVEQASKVYFDSLSEKEKEELDIKESDVLDLYHRYAIATKLYGNLTGGVNEEVSDDDARIVDMLQIFVTTKETADSIAKKLKEGSDFKTLANYYNEEATVEVSFGKDDVSDSVVKSVFQLEPGDISDCIETEKGFYFFQCVSKLDREKTDENKILIVKNRAKAAFDDVYDEFLSGLTTEYNKQQWNKIDMDFGSDITTNSFFDVFGEYCGDFGEKE